MTRPMKVNRPTTIEVRQLHKSITRLTNVHQQRRAEALILYGMGLSALEIAAAQGVHPHTIYRDLHTFEQKGVVSIEELQMGGAPEQITPAQVQTIVQLTNQSPTTVGLPYGRWSLRKLRGYLVKKHIVRSVSAERLRQLLKKRCDLSTCPAQTHQPRPATPGDSDPYSLGFQAFARQRAAVVFRCQADCRQSLWWSPVYVG